MNMNKDKNQQKKAHVDGKIRFNVNSLYPAYKNDKLSVNTNDSQQPKPKQSTPKHLQVQERKKIKTEPLKLYDMLIMEDLISLEENLTDPPKVKSSTSSTISLKPEEKAEHFDSNLIQKKITISIINIDRERRGAGQNLNPITTPSEESIVEKVQEKRLVIEKGPSGEENHSIMRSTRSQKLSPSTSTNSRNQVRMRASRSQSTTNEKQNLIKTSILEKGEIDGKRASSIRKVGKKRGASIQKVKKERGAVETTSKNDNKKLEIATLVWARLSKKDPFWPAFVHGVKEFDPFFRVTSKGKKDYREYHVVFFDTPITWCWIRESNIELFTGNDVVDDINLCEDQNIKPTLQNRFNVGLLDAIKSTKLTPETILENYYFDPAKNFDDLRYQKFEVEDILNKRLASDGAVEYYIKWENYPPSYNTWEPIANLDCEELIKDFEENLKDKHSKQRGASSKTVQQELLDFGEEQNNQGQDPNESDASTTDISVTYLENSPPKKKVIGRTKRKRATVTVEKDIIDKKRTREQKIFEVDKKGDKSRHSLEEKGQKIVKNARIITANKIKIKKEKMEIDADESGGSECEDIMVMQNRRSSTRIKSNALQLYPQITIRNYAKLEDWYIKLSTD